MPRPVPHRGRSAVLLLVAAAIIGLRLGVGSTVTRARGPGRGIMISPRCADNRRTGNRRRRNADWSLQSPVRCQSRPLAAACLQRRRQQTAKAEEARDGAQTAACDDVMTRRGSSRGHQAAAEVTRQALAGAPSSTTFASALLSVLTPLAPQHTRRGQQLRRQLPRPQPRHPALVARLPAPAQPCPCQT